MPQKKFLEISWTLSPIDIKINNMKYSDQPHIKLLLYVSSTISFLYFFSQLPITLWDSGLYRYYPFRGEEISNCHHITCMSDVRARIWTQNSCTSKTRKHIPHSIYYLIPLFLTIIQLRQCHYSHVVDEKIEAQKRSLTECHTPSQW